MDSAIVSLEDLLNVLRVDLASKGVFFSLLDSNGYLSEYYNLNKVDENVVINRLISTLGECKQMYLKLGVSVTLLEMDSLIRSIEMRIKDGGLTHDSAIIELSNLL